MPTTNKGKYGEETVKGYLAAKGYDILDCGYRCPYGEIDIIARDGEYIVFVEVKYRRSIKAGLPREAVTPQKQRRIINAALWYIGRKNLSCQDFRFDVAEVFGREILDINHIENAFMEW